MFREWCTVTTSLFKVRGISGPEPNDQTEITILGRTVEWHDWGIKITADPRHAQKIIKYFELDKGSKSLEVLGDCEPEETRNETMKALNEIAF